MTRRDITRAVAWLVWTGLIVLLNFADRSKPPAHFFFRWDSFAAIVVNSSVLFLAPALILARGDWQLLGYTRPKRIGRTALYALVGVGGTLLLGAIVDALYHATDKQGLAPTHWVPHHTAAFVANLLGISIVVPIAEETFFRGAGLGALTRVYSVSGSIFLVGCLFGLAHGLIAGFLPLAFLGVMLALMRTTSGSVVPGIVLHGMYNAAVVILSLTL